MKGTIDVTTVTKRADEIEAGDILVLNVESDKATNSFAKVTEVVSSGPAIGIKIPVAENGEEDGDILMIVMPNETFEVYDDRTLAERLEED